VTADSDVPTTSLSSLSSLSSLRACTAAFREAGEPTIELLLGRLRATSVGPSWMRWAAPLFLAATGMPGWWGKEFASAEQGTVMRGHNIVDRDGSLVLSLAMTARLGASHVDARPALVATYDSDAPWPWRDVRDELRPLVDGSLLGLSFGLVPPLPTPAPFLLTRVREGGRG
jgi:hypothetical protein